MTTKITIKLDERTVAEIKQESRAHGISLDSYIQGLIDRHIISQSQAAQRIPRAELLRIMDEVLSRDAEVYRRLAAGVDAPRENWE
jgi:hypothetical protein